MDQEQERISEFFNKLSCRLCLKVDVVHMNIFGLICREKQVAMKLATCLSLKVSENDKLPQNICFLCFLTLEATYELRDTALKSDKIMRAKAMLYSTQEQLDARTATLPMAIPILGNKECDITNTSEFVLPTIDRHNIEAEILSPVPDSESTPFQFSTPKAVQNFKHKNIKKKSTEMGLKVIATNTTAVHVAPEKQEQLKVVNDKLLQTPRPKKHNVLGQCVEADASQSSMMKRKRHREQSAENMNSQIQTVSQSHAGNSKLMAQASVPSTPRSSAALNSAVTPRLAEKHVLHKRCKELMIENENSLTANNCKTDNNVETSQTPKASQHNKLLKKIPARPLTENQATIVSAAKEIESKLLQQRMSTPKRPNNVLEHCKENTGNILKSKRESISKFIDQCREEIRNNTPAKLLDANEMASDLESPRFKKKKLEKDRMKLANKHDFDIFEFSEDPIVESVPVNKSTKKLGKRQSACSELPHTQSQKSYEKDEANGKKSGQGKSSSLKVNREPSPSNNDASDSSFGILLKELTSSQSDKPEVPAKPERKPLPVDIRNSWKKSQGNWQSQQSCNDVDVAGCYEACLATGDIFGASIATKKIEGSPENVGESSVNIQQSPKKKVGTSLLTSSSPDDPKSSTSSFHMSSPEDHSPKISTTRSKTPKQNVITTLCPKDVEAKLVNAKVSKYQCSLPLQANITKPAAPKEDGSSDSGGFHLTPEFKKMG